MDVTWGSEASADPTSALLMGTCILSSPGDLFSPLFSSCYEGQGEVYTRDSCPQRVTPDMNFEQWLVPFQEELWETGGGT